MFQLNETTTAFLGGSRNQIAIYTYNWQTQNYTTAPNQLLKPRQSSACALFKGNNSESLVRINLNNTVTLNQCSMLNAIAYQ